MGMGKIALIGLEDDFASKLKALFIDNNFEPEIINVEFKHLGGMDTSGYDLIIIRSDFAVSGGEQSFFDFLLSASSFMLVNDGSKTSPQYLYPGMSLEEIMMRVGNSIFTTGQRVGLPARNSARITVNNLVEYSYDGRFFKSNVITLSNNGCYIASLAPHPKDSLLDISLELEAGICTITAKGRVLYSVGYDLQSGIISRTGTETKKALASPGMAVFFEQISEDDLELVKSFIDKNVTNS